ncbi:L-asparaginase [Lachnospiraceae bacterium PM6-15]|uniref:asparaginase n=1 Tax=Ohessyouella blattaphilus TaxID=2949333 RepID=UPI003E1CD0BD
MNTKRETNKNILFIATGGTVASSEGGNGLTPALTGDLILAKVPEVDHLCNLSVLQLMNIDSTNMAPDNWLKIAETILEEYDGYDGFVILHGTDTMAYTAAALSYLIQNSPKPIVLTGSQKPISNPFTDAKLNIYQSVLYALDKYSCNVSIVFNNQVIAGTRVKKQRTRSYNAFESMNFTPLAHFIENRILRRVKDPEALEGELLSYDKMCDRVAVLKLSPGLSPNIFKAFEQDVDALILETFGIGGIPEYDGHSFETAIRDFIAKGKTIILTTQVPEEGLDLSRYEVGNKYTALEGVLEAGNMTTEAIVAKIMWILGQTDKPREIKKMFYKIINYDRGE